MAYTALVLKRIFTRTNGCCHLCQKQLAYINYGLGERRGGWEVEHSIPRAKGGTDHGNNLFAAHITCNRRKGALSSRTVRRWHGKTRAPYSATKLEKIREENGVTGACVFGTLGMAAGPAGALLLACLGYGLGETLSPNR